MFISLQANLQHRTQIHFLTNPSSKTKLFFLSKFNLISMLYPNARAVTPQATTDEAPADAKLSLLHVLMWLPPKNFDTMPRTAASIEKIKKNMVAPFPPKPESKRGSFNLTCTFFEVRAPSCHPVDQDNSPLFDNKCFSLRY